MKSTRSLPALLLFVLGLAPLAQAQDRHVVLISIDGLSNSYLDNPRADIPTIRRLAAEGARAEALVTTFPSLTWPAHISLMTGCSPAKHGIVSNIVIDRQTRQPLTYIGDPFLTTEECVKAPTIFDALHAAGKQSASVIWPGTAGAKNLAWAIPDSNLQRVHDRHTTPGLADELDAAGISIRKLGVWGWDHRYSAMRDATYTRAAIHLLKQHKPALLMLHLISPDGVEHDSGPDVEEAYWACGDADRNVRAVWEALQEPPFQGNSTLLIVSDHGFAEYTQVVHLNYLLRQMGLIEVDEKEGKITRQVAWAHSNGGSAGIYIFETDPAKYAEVYNKVVSVVARQQGVEQVLKASDFTKLGLPDPHDNPEQPELMVTAKPGFAFSNAMDGPDVVAPADQRRGAHGHLPDLPFMHAMLVAHGAGIKPGKVGKASVNDVAPTIAKLLGVELPSAEGKPIDGMLQ